MAEKIWTPKLKDDLKKLLNANIALSSIDTSLISDMSELFKDSKRTDFSGIERWNTSNVINMQDMFMNATHFNSDISAWDTSKVVNMQGMFAGANSFNQPLDSWNVSNVEEMAFMFSYAESFNQNINDWNVSNVKNMGNAYALDYYKGNYDRKVSKYYYDNIENSYGFKFESNDLGGMFENAKSFNQPLNKWNVSNVECMQYMFYNAKAFNQNLDSWSVDISRIDFTVYDIEGSAMENNLPKWCKE